MLLPLFPVEGGPALALARGAADATLLAAFGALLFRALLGPPLLARMAAGAVIADARVRRFAWLSLLAAGLAVVGWLALQAVNLEGTVTAVPAVLRGTRFGHLVLLRLALLGLAAFALGRHRAALAAVLAGAAVVTQAGLGHAASMHEGPSWLLLSEILHLLAAGAWLGGLLPLLLVVATAAPDIAAFASRRFSPLGTACVAVLAGTALFQLLVLIGGVPGWVGTDYGLVAMLKLALSPALLGFAAVNRFRLTPALGGVSASMAKQHLCRSIAAETGVGLLVVLAAGLLTSLPPAMHVQPLWPFAQRLSLDAVREDPGFRAEVIQAGVALAGAAVLLLLAALARRIRWPAVAAAAVIAWFAVPHFGLLLVDATPTSFYRSPTDFAAAAIAHGAQLYPEHCAACHGAEGRGDGPAAKGLPVPPADLTAGHLWMHGDGEMFWWLSQDVQTAEGEQAMPGFAGVLSEDDRWDLIDYVRAHNAGTAMRETGGWSPPVRAPGLDAVCGARTVSLDDLRGRVVRLVGTAPPSTDQEVVTVLATADPIPSGAGICVADDEAVPRAYAIVSGIPVRDLPGTQFLIDGDSWLRALQRPGASPSWDDPQVLAAEIREIRAHPIATGSGSGHDMPMPMHMKM